VLVCKVMSYAALFFSSYRLTFVRILIVEINLIIFFAEGFFLNRVIERLPVWMRWGSSIVGVVSLVCTACVTFRKEMPQRDCVSMTSTSWENWGKELAAGSLSLQKATYRSLLASLQKEVSLLAKVPSTEKKTTFLLGLRSSKTECRVQEGEQVFLSCDVLPAGMAPTYRVAEYRTPLWIRPNVCDGRVMLEVGLFTAAQNSDLFREEKMRWPLLQEEQLKTTNASSLHVVSLQKAKIWGRDLALGKIFPLGKDKIKIEIPYENTRIFYFLEEGDFFRFEEGRWVPILQATCDGLMAQVKSASAQGIEWEVWDAQTMHSCSVQVNRLEEDTLHITADLLPSSCQKRGDRQASCFLGKRRYLVKEGDWLIKTLRGWKRIQGEDIQKYLQHHIIGELYIFESFAQEQGRDVMKGVIISKMRTKAYPFLVPLSDRAQEKSPLNIERKRRVLPKWEGKCDVYLPPLIGAPHE